MRTASNRGFAWALPVGLAALTAATFAQEAGPAGPSNTGRVLREALEAQVKALNAEDPDRVMAGFHEAARGREEARRNLVTMFRQYDLRYALEGYHFIGEEERYAYARGVQSSREARGGSTRTEQLFVFRRDGRSWRFWTSTVLDQLTTPKKGR